MALLCGWLAVFGGVSVGVAYGNALTRVETVYASGGIPACKFTGKELEAALSEIPSDVAQYDADLINAIHQALSAQAGGACAARSGSGVVPAGAGPRAGGSGGSASDRLPLPGIGAGTAAGAPAPLIVLAVFGGLLLLVGVVWGAGWLLGLEPSWALRARHAWREGEFRAGGALAAFGERLRARR
jgi:hypothetical protein